MTKTGTGNRRQNNLDLLRVIAASLVIYSHCYVLAEGDNKNEPLNMITGGITLGALSVAVFFVISGYLITRSWNNQPDAGLFFWKRILRIYPGLTSAILFATLLVGPLASSLSFREYFLGLDIYSIIKSFVLLAQADLPGVFEDNRYPKLVNGALWTLAWEAKLYVITALLGRAGAFRKKWPILFIVFAGISTYNLLHLNENYYLGKIVNRNAVYYLIGMCFSLYETKIKYDPRLGILLAGAWLISLNTGFVEMVSYVSIPYLVLYCASRPANYLRKITDKGDYSYGLYIYAFPIQQTIVHLFQNQISPTKLFIIAYPLTLLVAILSWNCIEKKALEFKKVQPEEIYAKISSIFSA